MAQTGYTPILIYSSSTASQAPAAGNLTNSTLGSELAINITDGKLFYKDNANAVQVIGWKIVPTTAGGTGLTSYTAGDLLYYASGTTLSKLAIGANTTIMTSSGTAPQWTAASSITVGTATNLAGGAGGSVPYQTGAGATGFVSIGTAYYMLGVNAGGTAPSWQPSATSVLTTQGDLLYASAANTLARLAKNTTATRYLANTGSSNNPSWDQVNLANGVTGTLPVGNGGTGITTTPTNGQIPIGNGTNYTAATLTAGGGIGITNGAGSVTIATSSPTFSAYGNAAQTVTAAVFTKVTLNAEDYDTNNNFDSTTNYRFTPTVAGYYHLTLKLAVAATSLTRVIGEFRKNGSGANYGRAIDFGWTVGAYAICDANTIMYFNGSSDYCEIWVYLDGTGTITTSQNDKNTTFFQGSMIRAA